MAIGIWFVGARGSVATTVTVGLAALKLGATGTRGLVTELPEFTNAPLPAIGDFVTGGHDISNSSVVKQAEALAAEGVFTQALLAITHDELVAADQRIRPGIDTTSQPRQTIAALQNDIRNFQSDQGLESVIVVNVSSTEELMTNDFDLATLNAALDNGDAVLAPSSLYAYAALDAGFPFVDFTPSTGARLVALEELAALRGVPHAGSDGKTGETLVKTTLATMFATRNLEVRSWSGLNLLGGGDGATLDDPVRKASKLQSKSRSLEASLGYAPHHPINIEYVPDLGQWKTAWNLISFEGFLGTAMKLQFTWEGCDSALAAPLIIDLARLTYAAHESGQSGALGALGFFFKDPAGNDEHRLSQQFDELCGWAAKLRTS